MELTGIHFINERKGVVHRMPIEIETSHFIEPRYYKIIKLIFFILKCILETEDNRNDNSNLTYYCKLQRY